MSNKNIAIIIGAGPAGLTAAYELLEKTNIKPIIFESTNSIGGISKTVNYNGYRMDMGGHRFFSKSDKVMKWWLNILPIQEFPSKDDIILNRRLPINFTPGGPDPEKEDRVMLYRKRISRIFYLRKFFDYPVTLNLNTIKNLGLYRITKIGFSYIFSRIHPRKPEKSLEDFMINRFGEELYKTFFKDYTEKVWGIKPSELSPEFGSQRIKGLSISKVILHAIKNILIKENSISQKKTETSLIEQFLYPKYGPGQMWEEVANIITRKGGEIYLNNKIVEINTNKDKIISVIAENQLTKEKKVFSGDYFFSSMPVKDLINSLKTNIPENVKYIANGLVYRDFITIGLLLNELKIKNQTNIPTINNLIPDNWIYIQERDVKIGRLQIFNNWSPYLVKDLNKVWIGLEYFCNEGDEFWNMNDNEIIKFAINELSKIDIIEKDNVLDSHVVRVQKAYPAYYGTYKEFHVIKDFINKFENLFLIGRNGMHRYNNMDHSMLTAITAVDNIINNSKSKDNIWAVNTEEEYHEEKSN